MEIGRFKYAGHVFQGLLDGDRVTEQSENGETHSPAETRDYGDLVVLSPVQPRQIIEVELGSGSPRYRLRPNASVGPHRAMVTVPRDRRVVAAAPRLGWILDRPLHKANSAVARHALKGFLTAIVFHEESPFSDDKYSMMSIAQEGFTTLGASVLLSKVEPSAAPTLWHNGRPQPSSGGEPLDPCAVTAALSRMIRIGEGDLILAGHGSAVEIRPGDHVECRCAPLRPAAVNVGLRGSA